MTSIFTDVSWLPVPLVKQVTGPRATTVNIVLTLSGFIRFFKSLCIVSKDSKV